MADISLDRLQYLSGPASLYKFTFGGRNFYFLGDVHFDPTFNCDWFKHECSDIDSNFGVTSDNKYPTCVDLIAFLKIIFDKTRHKEEYIDFFTEVPVRGRGKQPDIFGVNELVTEKYRLENILEDIRRHPEHRYPGEIGYAETHLANIHEKYMGLDYISRIYFMFNRCFQRTKTTCEYAPYVRFHYADIRHLLYKGKVVESFISQCRTIFRKLFEMTRLYMSSPSEEIKNSIIGTSWMIHFILIHNAIRK